MTHVLDACALIAWLKKEPGANVVDGLFDKAEYGEIDLCINIVNLVEVYYGFMREFGEDRAQEIMRTVQDTVIEVIDTTNGEVFEEVARLKSALKNFPLPMPLALPPLPFLAGLSSPATTTNLANLKGR
jgi:hypothetical protein